MIHSPLPPGSPFLSIFIVEYNTFLFIQTVRRQVGADSGNSFKYLIFQMLNILPGTQYAYSGQMSEIITQFKQVQEVSKARADKAGVMNYSTCLSSLDPQKTNRQFY